MNRTGFFAAAAVVVAGLGAAVFLWPREEGVTLYCSTDDVIARPILDQFETETGVHVNAVFDTEAAKTESVSSTSCGSSARTRRATCSGTTRSSTRSVSRTTASSRRTRRRRLPTSRRTSRTRAACGRVSPRGRASSSSRRTRRCGPTAERPKSMKDLVNPKWKGRSVIAKPLTGTTLTHGIVLSTVLGDAGARKWFDGLIANQGLFPVGNGQAGRRGRAEAGGVRLLRHRRLPRDRAQGPAGRRRLPRPGRGRGRHAADPEHGRARQGLPASGRREEARRLPPQQARRAGARRSRRRAGAAAPRRSAPRAREGRAEGLPRDEGRLAGRGEAYDERFEQLNSLWGR